MKKILVIFTKSTLVLILISFISVFVWANWEVKGPGSKAPIVNFLQFDASSITDTIQLQNLNEKANKIEGVKGSVYNKESKIFVVSYEIDKTTRETIQEKLNKEITPSLSEKNFKNSGPKCPIDVSYIVKIKRFLYVRG